MRSALFIFLLIGLLAPVARAQSSTRISTNAPIINFRLPTFTPEGYRDRLVRGSEAVMAGTNDIEIKELTLTIFTGDASDKIETLILSPQARVAPETQIVTGDSTIRVINDQFEATGSQWSCIRKEKKISIAKNVRVTFRAEFKDLLK